MWIKSIYIDGFGLFHEQIVEDLTPGLTIFLGKNESGKTTLMEFIRSVLFGWPRGDNTYPPLRGGRYGGRLGLVMRDGTSLTIERYERTATVWAEGKTPERVEPSQRLFPGVNRELYRRLFAVGLDEMKGLDILYGEETRGRLLAASGGLRAGALVGALNRLDERMRALLAPRAQREINARLTQLRELKGLLDELRGQSAEYARTCEEQETARRRAAEARDEFARINMRLRRIEQLEQAREPWVQLQGLNERIAALERARAFPADGWHRFETLEGAITDLKTGLQKAEADAERWQRQLESISVDESVLRQAPLIEELHRGADHLASAAKDLPIVAADLRGAEESLSQRLQALGPDWDVGRLDRVDTSLQAKQQVRAWAEEFERCRGRVDAEEAEVRAAKQALSEAESERDEAAQRLAALRAPQVADRGELDRMRKNVGFLRARLHELEMARIELEAQRRRHADVIARLDQLRDQRELGWPPLPWWISPVLGLVMCAVAAGLTARGWHVPAAVLFVTALMVALPLAIFSRAQARAARVRNERIEAQQKALAGDREVVSRETGNLEAGVASLQEEVRRLAADLGLGFPVTVEDVEKAAQQVQVADDQLAGWENAQQDLADAQRKCQRARQRLGEAEDGLSRARAALSDLQVRWQEWLSSRGFEPGVGPSALEVLLQAVEAAREARRTVDVQRERVSRMTAYLSDARARIMAALEACGRSVPQEPGVGEIAALREALEQARESERQRQMARDRLSELQLQIEQLKRQLAEKDGELRDLFAQVGVLDRNEFSELKLQSEELHDREKKAEECLLRIRTIAGSTQAGEDLVRELGSMDAAEVATEKESLVSRRAQVECAIEQAVRQEERATRRLQELATDYRLSDALLKEKTLAEEVRQLVREWAANAVCRALIERARTVYERERQPQVIKEAEGLLETMLAGRYALRYSFQEGDLRLQESESMAPKDEAVWSRGLAEQVYLAVRLALAREFGHNAEPLPVMLDDVLVNFDPDRRRGAASVILHFAAEQQVFLFSCHPDLLDCLTEAARESGAASIPGSLYFIEDGVLQRQDISVI